MFDAYYKWLGIPPKDQPPNYYRLLSLDIYEKDLDVIEGSADRLMGFVRQYQSGEHAALAAKILNEIATARLCLLKPVSKAEYDTMLKGQLVAKQTSSNDGVPSFAADSDIAEIVKTSKSLPKRKKKKAQSLPTNFLIAGGVGAVVVVVLIGVSLVSTDKPPVTPAPTEPVIARSIENPQPVKETPIPQIPAKSPEVLSKPSAPPTPQKSIPLIKPLPVENAVGPSVDLFENVDLNRDKYSGEWKKEGKSLIGGPGGRIYLPTKLPKDYQLQFKAKRISDNDTLTLGFIMAGRLGSVSLDAYHSSLCGLYVDDHSPDSNCTTRRGALFENNKSSTIIMNIHEGHLHVTFDGRTIIDWYGSPDRLFLHQWDCLPNQGIPYISVSQATYQIESAVMTPIKEEPEEERVAKLDATVDLMPLLNTERDSKRGKWLLEKNVLASLEDDHAQFSLPTSVPTEYTLSATFEVPTNSQARPTIVAGLIAGNSYFSIVLSNERFMGIERIDGERWDSNETRLSSPPLVPGKPVKFSVTVTRSAIRVERDDRTLIHWTGDFRRLGVQHDWAPIDGRKLFLGTGLNVKIRDIQLGPPVDPPKLPSHPEFKIGRPVDLLPLIDPKRDAFEGSWEKDAKSLRVLGTGDQMAKLVIPCEVPAEYKLTMRITREKGGVADKEAMILKLPTTSSMANVVLDGWASTMSMIAIDQLRTDDPKNNSLHRVQALPAGQSREMVVYVRRTGLKVMIGKNAIVDWTGNPNRFYQETHCATPAGRIALCSDRSRFRFEKLEIEPLEPTSFPDVAPLGPDGNLLAIIDPIRDSRKGQWTRVADGLVSSNLTGHRLTIPVVPPEQYVISADIERRAGQYEMSFGLVVGGQTCDVVLDGGTSHTGLELVDDKQFDDKLNFTRREFPQPLLAKGKRAKVRCFVLRDAVLVTCDDKEVVKWRGDPLRLSIRNVYLPPNYSEEDRSQLWIGGWESEFLIRELTLKPLNDEESTWVLNKFNGS